MFGLFKKRSKKRVEIPEDMPDGLFQMVWEKKRQPSPGAQAFAFESLGLVAFTPIGPSVTTRDPRNPISAYPQPAVGLAVGMDGIPTTAGQMFGQPLYDPSAPGAGYTTVPMPIVNNPFPFSSEPVGGKAI